jgi:hypothetical protein
MRRAFSALGAVYFAFALLVPMLAAFQAESRLPICCRRSGAHHCVMGMGYKLDIGNAVGVSSDAHCPLYPRSMGVAATQEFVLTGKRSLAASLLPVAVVRVRNAELSRIARERQLQLRGPPTLVTTTLVTT